MVVIVIAFLKRKNSGVQTAPKSRATSCDCIKKIHQISVFNHIPDKASIQFESLLSEKTFQF